VPPTITGVKLVIVTAPDVESVMLMPIGAVSCMTEPTATAFI